MTVLFPGTPYMHAVFHLLSSIAAYRVFVMFSLLDIYRRQDMHNFHAVIRYFPCSTKFGLPYITLRQKRV